MYHKLAFHTILTKVRTQFISQKIIYYRFRSASNSESGIGDIKKYVCLAHVADPNDGVLKTMSSAENKQNIKWKFTTR